MITRSSAALSYKNMAVRYMRPNFDKKITSYKTSTVSFKPISMGFCAFGVATEKKGNSEWIYSSKAE